jgi:hypothetical protein
MHWTFARDQVIRRGRVRGKAWRSIAAELELPIDVVMRHAVDDLGLPAASHASALDRVPLTKHQEAVIRKLRAERYSWTVIAGCLGLRAWQIDGHARRLGLAGDNVKHDTKPRTEPPPLPSLDARPPLPPGHPLTWASITAGTCLEGTPYPLDLIAR